MLTRSGVLAAVALVLGLVLAPAVPASADTTAFWGYWQADGAHWAFAKTGPATAHPKEGAVEGWRFAKASGNTGVPPHAKPEFARLCGPSAAPAGSKRVAVVIDYGDPADAPGGATPPAVKTACAIVPADATGSDVLAKVARPTADKSGLICAIDSFGTCAQTAPAAAPSATPSAAATPARGRRSAGSTALSVGIGLLLILAAGGSTMAVRRRAKQ